MSQTYRVMAPEVIADVIDGEGVIMKVKSASYFSSEGVRSDCWVALASGNSRTAMPRTGLPSGARLKASCRSSSRTSSSLPATHRPRTPYFH